MQLKAYLHFLSKKIILIKHVFTPYSRLGKTTGVNYYFNRASLFQQCNSEGLFSCTISLRTDTDTGARGAKIQHEISQRCKVWIQLALHSFVSCSSHQYESDWIQLALHSFVSCDSNQYESDWIQLSLHAFVSGANHEYK